MSTLFAIFLVGAGIAALLIAGIGAIRLPDFYTRSHALGVMDTLGAALVLGGIAVYHGLSFTTAKTLLLLAFFFVANPTVTHVLVRAALRSGLRPWQEGGPRD